MVTVGFLYRRSWWRWCVGKSSPYELELMTVVVKLYVQNDAQTITIYISSPLANLAKNQIVSEQFGLMDIDGV